MEIFYTMGFSGQILSSHRDCSCAGFLLVWQRCSYSEVEWLCRVDIKVGRRSGPDAEVDRSDAACELLTLTKKATMLNMVALAFQKLH